MRRVLLVLGGVFVLVCLLLLALMEGWIGAVSPQFVARLEYAGYLAIGWGTGVTGWLMTGHLGTSCLFGKVPRAWTLWQEDVLASRLPIFKYLTAGVLLFGLGAVLGYHLWGLSTEAFDFGLLVGAAFGAVYSGQKVRQLGNEIDFLDANQRYLNEKNVSLFSDKWT